MGEALLASAQHPHLQLRDEPHFGVADIRQRVLLPLPLQSRLLFLPHKVLIVLLMLLLLPCLKVQAKGSDLAFPNRGEISRKLIEMVPGNLGHN